VLANHHNDKVLTLLRLSMPTLSISKAWTVRTYAALVWISMDVSAPHPIRITIYPFLCCSDVFRRRIQSTIFYSQTRALCGSRAWSQELGATPRFVIQGFKHMHRGHRSDKLSRFSHIASFWSGKRGLRRWRQRQIHIIIFSVYMYIYGGTGGICI